MTKKRFFYLTLTSIGNFSLSKHIRTPTFKSKYYASRAVPFEASTMDQFICQMEQGCLRERRSCQLVTGVSFLRVLLTRAGLRSGFSFPCCFSFRSSLFLFSRPLLTFHVFLYSAFLVSVFRSVVGFSYAFLAFSPPRPVFAFFFLARSALSLLSRLPVRSLVSVSATLAVSASLSPLFLPRLLRFLLPLWSLPPGGSSFRQRGVHPFLSFPLGCVLQLGVLGPPSFFGGLLPLLACFRWGRAVVPPPLPGFSYPGSALFLFSGVGL